VLLAAMLASEGCRARPPASAPAASPVAPQATTAEGRLCMQNCQGIDAVCLGGSNQGRIDSAGSTPGGILLAI